MADPVLQTVPLGFQWATVDPFLFCVHHLDHYPAANEHMGPAASLEARDLGMDFAGADGWRMYHGSTRARVPRSTPTGASRRSRSCGRASSTTPTRSAPPPASAGATCSGSPPAAGIVHCEMFPLLDRDGPNPCELFQIWLNLPAADKMVEPYFTMLWDEDIPRHVVQDREGRTTEVTVIAGALAGLQPSPAAAELVGLATRGRRRHLARGARSPARSWSLPPADGRRHRPHALRVRRVAAPSASTSSASSVGAVVRADEPLPIAGGRGREPRCSCCRAGRSVSRSRSTARS